MKHSLIRPSAQSLTQSQTQLSSRIVACLALLLLSPLLLINICISLLCIAKPLSQYQTKDINGRIYSYSVFQHGVFKHAPILLLIIRMQMNWFGSPRDLSKDDACYASCFSREKMGLVSLYSLHRLTGLSVLDLEQDMQEQRNFSVSKKATLLLKYFVASIFYSALELEEPAEFKLFDIRIDNATLDNAVSEIIQPKLTQEAKTVCFVNVNSFNLAHGSESLRKAINAADFVYADGSGARIAAKKKGVRLVDNVNGTDMLPKLCERAVREGKRIFLLGAKPGVAAKTAANLQAEYPGLQISGTHHGYFDQANCDDIIEQINQVESDIVLAAFGSPIQEHFLQAQKAKLKVDTIVAVGGLFDFFSGDIARAPMWMRELGIEWVWRLIQEPKAKFHRYVIGNPIFLFRCYFQH